MNDGTKSLFGLTKQERNHLILLARLGIPLEYRNTSLREHGWMRIHFDNVESFITDIIPSDKHRYVRRHDPARPAE